MAIVTNLDKVAPIVSEYKLPSCGLLYGSKFKSTIKIKPYSFDTERILVTNLAGDEKMASVAAKVIDLPKGFDPTDLLVYDVLTILAIARGLTYGEEFSFKSTCPECGTSESHQVKIPKDLPVKTWNEYENKEALEAALEVVLPHCKDKVKFRYFTMKDEKELNSEASRIAAAAQTSIEEERYLTRLAMHIVSVNNGTPDNLTEARTYIKRLQGPDMTAYDDAITEKRCGIVYTWQVMCNNEECHHRYEATVPMAGNFFR